MRFIVPAEINALGEDQVAVIMSTAALARDGHILVPMGCRLENYRRNPIVLWQHDPNQPIGNAENISVSTDQIAARIRFAPLGISPKADEIRGLMKSGVIRAVSVSFDPLETTPLDSKKPRGGQRITSWDLLELSAVSVGADVNAVVTARALAAGKTDAASRADFEFRQRQLEALTLASVCYETDFEQRQREAAELRKPDYSYARRQSEARRLAPRPRR